MLRRVERHVQVKVDLGAHLRVRGLDKGVVDEEPCSSTIEVERDERGGIVVVAPARVEGPVLDHLDDRHLYVLEYRLGAGSVPRYYVSLRAGTTTKAINHLVLTTARKEVPCLQMSVKFMSCSVVRKRTSEAVALGASNSDASVMFALRIAWKRPFAL